MLIVLADVDREPAEMRPTLAGGGRMLTALDGSMRRSTAYPRALLTADVQKLSARSLSGSDVSGMKYQVSVS